MKLRTILGLIIVLIMCSCNQQSSEGDKQNKNDPNQETPKNGLRIEYKPTRGMNYTDSLGAKYIFRLIPCIFTNDTTVPLDFQIAFSKGYDYPTALNQEQFNVFPLPEVFGLDGIDVTDQLNLLPNYMTHPFFNKTLGPGEKCVMAIGLLRPASVNYHVFPIAIFSQQNRINHACDSLTDPIKLPIKSNNPHLALEVALGLGSQHSLEACFIISGGQISYPE